MDAGTSAHLAERSNDMTTEDSPPVAFPTLVIVPIEDVRNGDILWGWEYEANYPRKGWHVEPEGAEVRRVADLGSSWVINSLHFLKGRKCPRYFLIEKAATDR
jgi:hypothetical protein